MALLEEERLRGGPNLDELCAKVLNRISRRIFHFAQLDVCLSGVLFCFLYFFGIEVL